MDLKLWFILGVLLTFNIGFVSADVQFGSHIAPALITVNLTDSGVATEEQVETSNNILTQIYQASEDLLLWLMRDTDQCQLIVDDDPLFSSVDINKHTWVTEYEYMEYLPAKRYYWKVRCLREGRWSMWSDTRSFNYIADSIYFDWTVI